MELGVYSKVATLARGDDVCRILAWGVAFAEVGGGEPDESLSPLRLSVVAFGASACAWVGRVQSALAGAFALFAGACEADGVREIPPTGAVFGVVNGHQVRFAARNSARVCDVETPRTVQTLTAQS